MGKAPRNPFVLRCILLLGMRSSRAAAAAPLYSECMPGAWCVVREYAIGNVHGVNDVSDVSERAMTSAGG